MVIRQDKESQLVVNRMHEGDPSCKYKIGDRVKKAIYEEGDITLIDTEGRITGSIRVEGVDCYLVLFYGRELETFIVGGKIDGV